MARLAAILLALISDGRTFGQSPPPLEVRCGLVYSLCARPNHSGWISTIPSETGDTHMLVLGYAPFLVVTNHTSQPLTLDGGGSPQQLEIEFDAPNLGLRFEKSRGESTAFVTTQPVPLGSMYVIAPQNRKRFRMHLPGTSLVPSPPIVLAPGESRIFSPSLADASVDAVFDWGNNLTQRIEALSDWHGAKSCYLADWLTGGQPINFSINGRLNVISTRPGDRWDVEISTTGDLSGCEVFRYASPVPASWPAQPDDGLKVSNFPFRFSDSGSSLTCDSMLASPAEPIGTWALQPLFSVLLPSANNNFFLSDSDHDRLGDGWEIRYFGDRTAEGTADADGDGFSNQSEFFAGTSPVDAADHLRQSLKQLPGGGWQLEFPSIPGRSYYVESSTDLVEWKTVAGIKASSSNSIYPVPAPEGDSRFYRVGVPSY